MTTIRDEHLYHGAVLNQIADHKQFTAINSLTVKGKKSRCAFKVNDDIAVYIKHCGKPTGNYDEYVFTFNTANMKELAATDDAGTNLHMAFVCVEGREICCFPYAKFKAMVDLRKSEVGRTENQYTVLVTLEDGKSFRVYMMKPGHKKIYLDKPLVVSRNACPGALFR